MPKKNIHTYLHLGYMQKWLLIAGSIGVVAGLGAIVFFEAIKWSTYLFLGLGAGYYPPGPLGEGQPVVRAIARRWMLPVVTTIGGLLSGLIVYNLAPEAEGHGTDAAIDAFHNKAGFIRARVPLVKIVASAITIGSGGSAGREGPTAQIAAGFGSLLGRMLNLNAKDRRIAVAAGIGAGIGAIFKAPLGGALLSAEILYLNGFEMDALIPSFIASLVGYTIFASYTGYVPVFGQTGTGVSTNIDPLSLFYYALLGILCGVVGILYPKTFYAVRDFFKKLSGPQWLKPAIGGLIVGLMGIFLPQVLGMGYGWLQLNMLNNPIPLALVIGLAFAKILATSLSIGSGGSGGVFAPGLFIGGMIGTAWWQILHRTLNHVPVSPEPFIIVGMMALFGAVARAPLAVMLMVGEMTGGYGLMVPAMIAVGLAYILVGNNTIYESQVPTPADSPAHRMDYHFPAISDTRIEDVMDATPERATPETPIGKIMTLMSDKTVRGILVVNSDNDEHLLGIIARENLFKLPLAHTDSVTAGDVMTASPIVVAPGETLDEALTMMSDHDISMLPVVTGNKLVGLVTRRTIVRKFILAAAHE